MTEKEKAKELALEFSSLDAFIPNNLSIAYAIKCCEQIIKLDALTDEAWLNVPDEYKIQYWKEVIVELNNLKILWSKLF